jgi:hypothetical protein
MTTYGDQNEERIRFPHQAAEHCRLRLRPQLPLWRQLPLQEEFLPFVNALARASQMGSSG